MSQLLLLSLLPLLVDAQWGSSQLQYPQQPGQLQYPQQQVQQGQFPGQMASPYGQMQQAGYGQQDMFSQYQRMASAPMYRPPMGQPISPQFGANDFRFAPMMNTGANAMQQGMPSVDLMGRPSFGQYQNDPGMMEQQKQVVPPVVGPTRIVPPFMRGATPQELDKFYSIVQHPSWSPSEKQQQIDDFVRSLNVDAQNLYSEFSRSTQSETSSKRQKVHKIVSEMSQPAQIQFQKVSAVMTNPSLSDKERLEKVQNIYSKISDDIKKEFDAKLVDL